MEQRHDLGDRRRLVTTAVLTTLGGCEPQLEAHVNAAPNVGLAPRETVEATVHCAPCTGFPRTLNAIFVARDVFAGRGVTPLDDP
jgi:4-carboxymuconolactone decarboxylase